MDVQQCIVPTELPWWHRKKLDFALNTTREELPPEFTAQEWEHADGMFLWLDFVNCQDTIGPDLQLRMFETYGTADYWSVLAGHTTQDLLVADFTVHGAKEAFLGGALRKPEKADLKILRSQGLAGWISVHNKGDEKIELFVLPEFVRDALAITDCYALGP